RAGDRQAVLLFATDDGSRMAIPLSLVDRLEEFPRSALERVGPFEVVQYRDEILPLIHVSHALRQRRRSAPSPYPLAPRGEGRVRGDLRRRTPRARKDHETDRVQVVVYRGKSQRVGLVVDRILDIAEETLVGRSRAQRAGVLFTAVVQGRVTEFLDIEGIMRSVETDFQEELEFPSLSPLPQAVGERID